MRKKLKSSKEVVDEIIRLSNRQGQKKTAEQVGISPQYLHDIINGRRLLSKSVAANLGYEPSCWWVKKDQP